MAISWVGNAEGSAINGGDVTLDISGLGLAENDLVIVSYSIGDADIVDETMAMVTSGYTPVADLFGNDSRQVDLGVFYKKMTSSPDTSAVVDGFGGTNAAVAAVCQAFRGVDTTTPMDVAATTSTLTNTRLPNPPTIDYTTAGCWVVIAGACSHVAGAATMTNPTGYTTNPVDANGDDTVDTLIGMGYNASPSDPEDPGAFAISIADSASDAACAVTMALRPAAAVGNITMSLGAINIGF